MTTITQQPATAVKLHLIAGRELTTSGQPNDWTVYEPTGDGTPVTLGHSTCHGARRAALEVARGGLATTADLNVSRDRGDIPEPHGRSTPPPARRGRHTRTRQALTAQQTNAAAVITAALQRAGHAA